MSVMLLDLRENKKEERDSADGMVYESILAASNLGTFATEISDIQAGGEVEIDT